MWTMAFIPCYKQLHCSLDMFSKRVFLVIFSPFKGSSDPNHCIFKSISDGGSDIERFLNWMPSNFMSDPTPPDIDFKNINGLGDPSWVWTTLNSCIVFWTFLPKRVVLLIFSRLIFKGSLDQNHFIFEINVATCRKESDPT